MSTIKVDTIATRTGSGNITLSNNVASLTSAGAISGTNLTASGTLAVTGNSTVGGTLGVTSNSTVGGTLGVTGATTLSGDLTVDTNTLKVDSTNNKVGIGTSSPDTQLHITGNSSTRNSIVNTLTLDSGTAAANPYDGFGTGITFQGRDYGNAIRDYAYIRGQITNTDSNSGGGDAGLGTALNFWTTATGSGSNVPTERMRIGSTNGQFKFNGVYVYYFLGSVRNDTAAYVDVPGVQSAGVSLVTAQYTHHNINNYGAVRVASVASYGGGLVHALDIQNVSSSAGGSWSITMPSSGVLRVTKTAGTYAGSGFYWVKVETYYG